MVAYSTSTDPDVLNAECALASESTSISWGIAWTRAQNAEAISTMPYLLLPPVGYGCFNFRLSRLAPELAQLDHNPAFSFVNEKATSYKALMRRDRTPPLGLLFPENYAAGTKIARPSA